MPSSLRLSLCGASKENCFNTSHNVVEPFLDPAVLLCHGFMITNHKIGADRKTTSNPMSGARSAALARADSRSTCSEASLPASSTRRMPPSST